MTLKRKVGDKAKVVAQLYGHKFENNTIVEITHAYSSAFYYWAIDPNTGTGWAVIDAELQDIEQTNIEEIKPLTSEELYQKTRQLVRLQTLVEYIDETDTRSLTTSGADFLDEVKRLIEELKVQLGLPKV